MLRAKPSEVKTTGVAGSENAPCHPLARDLARSDCAAFTSPPTASGPSPALPLPQKRTPRQAQNLRLRSRDGHQSLPPLHADHQPHLWLGLECYWSGSVPRTGTATEPIGSDRPKGVLLHFAWRSSHGQASLHLSALEIEPRPVIHLALDQLQVTDLSLSLAVTEGYAAGRLAYSVPSEDTPVAYRQPVTGLGVFSSLLSRNTAYARQTQPAPRRDRMLSSASWSSPRRCSNTPRRRMRYRPAPGSGRWCSCSSRCSRRSSRWPPPWRSWRNWCTSSPCSARW